MPVLEPSTLLQIALFKEAGPRGSRKSVLVGLLRLRLNSLTSEVDHAAQLPMCSSRKQGGECTATLGLNIKVRNCLTILSSNCHDLRLTSEVNQAALLHLCSSCKQGSEHRIARSQHQGERRCKAV